MTRLKLIFFLLLLISFFSCKKTDETPPVITMVQPDSLGHVLNAKYEDPGATAFDETDGDITSSIYIDNQVNENLFGWYPVTYNVVDKAGNEAKPATRWVNVYNTSYIYAGYYIVTEQKVFPLVENYQYGIMVYADTMVNQRLIITSLAGNLGQAFYANVNDTIIEIPFQLAQYDSINTYSIIGSGSISDTLLKLEYQKKTDVETSYWESEMKR